MADALSWLDGGWVSVVGGNSRAIMTDNLTEIGVQPPKKPCPAAFPFPETCGKSCPQGHHGPGCREKDLCYNNSHDASVGSGPCGSWCLIDDPSLCFAPDGSNCCGCGPDPTVHACNTSSTEAPKPPPPPLEVSGIDVLVRALAAPYKNFTSKALLLKAGLGDKGGRLVATGFDILQAIHTPSGAANLSSLSPQKAWLLQRILQYAGPAGGQHTVKVDDDSAEPALSTVLAELRALRSEVTALRAERPSRVSVLDFGA